MKIRNSNFSPARANTQVFFLGRIRLFSILMIFVGIGLLIEIRYDMDIFSVFRKYSGSSHTTYKNYARHPESLVYDKTLEWDPNVHRLWLDTLSDNPPAMVLLDTKGFNQPNQSLGLGYTRQIRTTELYRGVINHPWFHPYAWEMISNGTMDIDPDLRYYVFFDQTTCKEGNYPNYGEGLVRNADRSYNRSVDFQTSLLGPNSLNKMFSNRLIYEERIFRNTTNNNVVGVVFDCSGIDISKYSIEAIKDHPISLVAISARISSIDESRDQGLVPPMPKPIILTEKEVHDIWSCEAEQTSSRPYHAVYIGNGRNGKNYEFNKKYNGGARQAYFPFHDEKNGIIILDSSDEESQILTSSVANMTYSDIMRNTSFGIAPRGDNKFSYRFSEVLSAGAIPVVHADDWLWPFRPEVVNWTECAIILPEKDAGMKAMNIMNQMDKEEKCKRRQKCYSIYKKYVEHAEGTILG